MATAAPVLDVEYRDEIVIATVMRETLVADAEIRQLHEALPPCVFEDQAIHMVLDFTNVKQVSSSALGFLIKLKSRLEKSQGRLQLCCIKEPVADAPNDRFVYEILKVVKLDTFFDIHESVTEALNA